MISIAFKSDFEREKLTKYSVLTESNSAVYGLFIDDLLVESGRMGQNEVDGFIKDYDKLFVSKFLGSKSFAFTHVDDDTIEQLKNTTQYHDVTNNNPNIYCCFNDNNLQKNTLNLKHFSSLIHQYYKDELCPVCFMHFGKNKLIICITGSQGFKFYNEYEIETGADAVYYTKAVLQNTDTIEDITKVILSGYIEDESELYKAVYRHFLKVEKASSNNFLVSNADINAHSYFDHFLNVSRI